MTSSEASPTEAQQPRTTPIGGGKKALMIFAAGCGGVLLLLLGMCGVGVSVGIMEALLPPQAVISYRGGNSDYMQLYLKNVSGRPLTNLIVHAKWRDLASARAVIAGTIPPNEERSFELRAQIDDSKLLRPSSISELYTPNQWLDMTNREQERAILKLSKSNQAAEALNNAKLDQAFSKPPAITVATASGEQIRVRVTDASQ